MPSTIKFDFTHYLPSISPGATVVQMPDGQCIPNNFVVAVICEDLIPGNQYRVSYQLLNPSTNPGNPINIFSPQIEDIFASFTTQKFATIADLDVQGNYIFQATLKDLSTNIQTAAQISLQCGNPAQPTPTPTCTPTITPSRFSRQNNVTVSIVDPDFDPIPDNVISLDTGVYEFPLVGLANNTIIGSKYEYEFFAVPAQSITFEKRIGEFYSGSSIQNFNSKIALSGSPKFVYVYAGVTDIENNITKYSEATLIKYLGNSTECLTVLPSGIDLKIGAPAFRSCNVRGLTTESVSYISGGSKFSIGDKLTAVGGGGYGAELQIQSGGITSDSFTVFSGGTGFTIGDYLEVTGGDGSGGLIKITSGGLSKESISSLTGSTGFTVGDLLTTTGGGGEGAIIRVTSIGPNGSILDFEILNEGYGFTFAPNGLVAITGNGVVSNVVFNNTNFSIPSAGGITEDSIDISGGTGYNINEILNIIGGGGFDAKIQIISGSITAESITSLGGGAGFSVGDLLTTTGGNGEGVVIRVKCVNVSGAIVNCQDGSAGWELVNGGYGFTSAPTGLVSLRGGGTNATILANSDNFSITPTGQITKDSISGLIGTGTAYTVGSKLIINGGGGSGAVIEITSVSQSGAILSYVIINGGSNYSAVPVILNENGNNIIPQPVWNISEFTDPSFVIIDQGYGYFNAPTGLASTNGNGVGAVGSYDVGAFTDPAFEVINAGSGYTGAPTGLKTITGDGTGFTVTFNASNFTIPPAGAITPESISLSGGSGYNIGDKIAIDGGGGEGAVIEVISGSLTAQSINSIVSGTGYAMNDYLTTVGGDGEGVVIKVTSVDGLGRITGWLLINGGYGFTGSPTGLVSITGNGSGAVLSANADNFTLTEPGGITLDSLSIKGGSSFSIGETITVSGGETSAELRVISGSLTRQSVTSITGGIGFSVGDLVTTTGGGGEGVVIRVLAVSLTGAIETWELVNGGHGFTGSPTGLVSLTGSGIGASVVGNSNNFSLTPKGGITQESIVLSGGQDLEIGDILNLTGGGGSGAQALLVSASLTSSSFALSGGTGFSIGDLLTTTGGGGEGVVIRVLGVSGGAITSWELVNAGYGFTGSPTGISVLTGSGNSSGTTFVGNSDHFSLTEAGGITSSSIAGLIGGGTGFSSGQELFVTGGGNSSPAIIKITGVDGSGRITGFVILDAGSGFDSTPVVRVGGINGSPIAVQPVFDLLEFTTSSVVIINSGTGYSSSPTLATPLDNTGSAISIVSDVQTFTNGSLIIIDSGSGFVSNPSSITSSGNGAGFSTTFNADALTDPSFVIINSGSGFVSSPTAFTSINGNGVGVSASFIPANFSDSAIIVTNPGSGYLDSPTALQVVSGYGSLNNIDVEFNDNNFIEISGAAIPTPTPTPTITPTPTMSLPAPCNDLQSAGGQNDIYLITVARAAPPGQNYLIVKDSPALQKSAILIATGLQNDTSIFDVEPFASSVSDDSGLKKIILSKNLSGPIGINAEITVYTIDIRIIKTSYWPGIMVFTYDAYSVPDRFRVIGMPVDKNKPEVLLYDSGFRGDQGALCENSYVQSLSGIGAGSVEILKPDGMIYVKVTVEAPCSGTAWEYLLSCPTRAPLISSTPTNTPTRTPTNTPTRTPNI